jgi:hypothetical protein
VGCFPLYNPSTNAPLGAGPNTVSALLADEYTNCWHLPTTPINFAGAFPDDVYIDVTNDCVPVLFASTISTLNGRFNPPLNSATNVVVDVYVPDPQGQTDGALFGYEFFGAPAPSGGFRTAGGWGFVQGKTHLGAFLDNGPYDSNPNVGEFSFNIAGLGLTNGTKVTVAVTYSKFRLPVLNTPVVGGGNVTLSWTGTAGGYTNDTFGRPIPGYTSGWGVQRASSITGSWTTTFAATNGTVLPVTSSAGFYRIVAPISGVTTLCAIPVTLP